MFNQEIVDRLRLVCPESGQRLSLAEAGVIDRLNRAVAAATLSDLSGAAVVEKMDAVLLTEDGRRAYPVIGEIPRLISSAAIDVGQLNGRGSP
ncbi:MAG: hypothetical protein VB835_15975 [Pirellulales bacterium]